MESEAFLSSSQSKLQAAYGPGVEALPPGFLASLLAFVMSLVSNCPAPTPAKVKAAPGTLIFDIQTLRFCHSEGVWGSKSQRALAATKTVTAAATDEDCNALIKAATDSQPNQ